MKQAVKNEQRKMLGTHAHQNVHLLASGHAHDWKMPPYVSLHFALLRQDQQVTGGELTAVFLRH